MRVPIPAVIFLVLTVVFGVWWAGTRHLDFTTPPSEAALEKIRIHVESSLPRTDQIHDAISAPNSSPPLPIYHPPIMDAQGPIKLGSLTAPLTLHDYIESAKQGSARTIELALALEDQSELRRSWLAWERVLDSTHANAEQIATTHAAIKLLRERLPEWNAKPELATPVTLRAITPRKFTKSLGAALEFTAREIEKASSGLIRVKTSYTSAKTTKTSKKSKDTTTSNLTLWIGGPDNKSISTETLSFPIESTENLRAIVLKGYFEILRKHFSTATSYTPPAELSENEDPLSALHFRITRLCWSEFAKAMNQPAPKTTGL